MKARYSIEIEEVRCCGECPFNYDGCGCCVTGRVFSDEEDGGETLIPKDCPLQLIQQITKQY